MTKKRNIISVSILIIVWILFITTVKSSQDDLYAENTETNKQVATVAPYIEENDTDIVQSCEVHPNYWMDNDEYELFAECVEAEAGTEGFTGKQYVVDVILNRVDSDKYPNTVKRCYNAETSIRGGK